MKNELESLYQFLIGARYASDGRASDVLCCACERLDEIIRNIDDTEAVKPDWYSQRGLKAPVDTNPSRE